MRREDLLSISSRSSRSRRLAVMTVVMMTLAVTLVMLMMIFYAWVRLIDLLLDHHVVIETGCRQRRVLAAAGNELVTDGVDAMSCWTA